MFSPIEHKYKLQIESDWSESSDQDILNFNRFHSIPIEEVINDFFNADSKSVDLCFNTLFVRVVLTPLNAADMAAFKKWERTYYASYYDDRRKLLLFKPRAITFLGMIRQYGIGTPNKFPDIAAELYRAIPAEPYANYCLGSMHLKGLWVKECIDTARNYLTFAEEHGVSLALYERGAAQNNFIRTNQSAIEYLEAGAGMGCVEAMCALAKKYLTQWPFNRLAAFKLYEKALSNGSPLALIELIALHESSQPRKAAFYFHIAVKRGLYFDTTNFMQRVNITSDPIEHYHIVLGLTKAETSGLHRGKFNFFRRNQPDLFYKLVEDSRDNLTDIKPLIDISSEEKAIVFAIIAQLNESHVILPLVEIIIQYAIPFSDLIENIFKNKQEVQDSTPKLSRI